MAAGIGSKKRWGHRIELAHLDAAREDQWCREGR